MQPQSQLTIRPVTITDAAQLQANCFSAVSVEQVQDAIHATLEATASGKELQLVAELAGAVVGSATLIRESHRLRAHRAGVFGLVVRPDYQGRGIARHLVDALAAHAQTLGIAILETSCHGGTDAEQVYVSLGFTEYGRLPQGLLETGEQPAWFDEVYFYRPVKIAREKDLL